ncbi:kinase-like protein [Gymnopus androsaceus JB14]|uniref:Kinase-like protein n=1 Tax=Gymnopus androsaceus JB14 TaxID=1447944 RepID=A0A6A4GYC5_9AGAR|nr:kinase-like protein [Gymnopus androsaceus JB14]
MLELIRWMIALTRHNSGLRKGTYNRRCLRALRHISAKYEILPSSLVVQDVQREGHNPVAGGGFADIWRGTIGKKSVCLKVLRLVIEPEEEVRKKIRKQFCNEALLWRQLKHPNILPLLGVNAELFNPSFCLISPWMANKDILSYLKQNPKHNRHKVLVEIAAGLSYLHSRDPPIIHGDIRGANILVSDDCRCCLADFGLALVTAESRTWSIATTSTLKGAIRWMAPELIIQDPSTSSNHASGDVYAFGCTIVEILTLQLPFHDQRTDAAVLYSLMSGKRPSRPKDVWCPDPIWALTTRCWTQDAAARPTAREVYEALQEFIHLEPG